MDYSKRLAISYYKTIATLNESHNIYLVQHQQSQKIYVKKILDVYNSKVYDYLLNSPINGIPKIIDTFENDNQLIVIEEYISGNSLSELIETNSITEDQLLKYMCDLCIILDKLHSCTPPIVHRDIKPSNIIITNYDNVILLDFNAAKHSNENSNKDTKLIGTEGYAAPEQYGFGASTPQTDIYSLGILLKELVTTISNPSKKYNLIINKCTQLDPKDRYKNIIELHADLYKLSNPNTRSAIYKKPYHKYYLPGFRTQTPWKMFFGGFTYIFLAWLSFTLEIEDSSFSKLWLERCFCFSLFMSLILFCSNYLNVHKALPLTNSKNILLKILGIIIYCFFIFCAIFMLLTVIEAIFYYN